MSQLCFIRQFGSIPMSKNRLGEILWIDQSLKVRIEHDSTRCSHDTRVALLEFSAPVFGVFLCFFVSSSIFFVGSRRISVGQAGRWVLPQPWGRSGLGDWGPWVDGDGQKSRSLGGSLPLSCGYNNAIFTTWLGMVYIFSIKMVILMGDGACKWHCFTHLNPTKSSPSSPSPPSEVRLDCCSKGTFDTSSVVLDPATPQTPHAEGAMLGAAPEALLQVCPFKTIRTFMDEWMAGIFFEDEWWWMMMSGADFLGSVGVQTDFLRQSRKEIHKDTGFHRAPGWNSASKTAAYCICWCFVLGCIWIYQLCLVGHISKFWRLKEVVTLWGNPRWFPRLGLREHFKDLHILYFRNNISWINPWITNSLDFDMKPKLWWYHVIPSPLVKH